ncbi:VOC family protein [Corynebacterium sp. CCUG 65737]|uniref:VOC family protein n=1 Tax=Corynebacterium sp. CCUG 65737 TaxID=2823889 RepID=UPI002108DAF0|nr:VOC family protein [Corynebacterium sp. CCUG 65737]MCQ4618390.1 VOC family protein [Corynebacterium pseudogenitalium]MCQ4627764.1 VOC family protein [Corynebacterium sp. CCUG 65737]
MIDRSIYPMPMFVTLPVTDLGAAEEFYHAAGFISLATIPGEDGSPALIHFRRQRYQDILAVPSGDITPGSSSVTFAAHDDDLGAIAEAIRATGAAVEGPVDTPWYTTDVTATDPDGHTIVFTKQRPQEAAQAQEWVDTFEMQ